MYCPRAPANHKKRGAPTRARNASSLPWEGRPGEEESDALELAFLLFLDPTNVRCSWTSPRGEKCSPGGEARSLASACTGDFDLA